jgi:hypothetical protein
MRLTLRTLLAYMDDILDPADQEELGRKIESSPFATELIHRSRDAVRRLRLSAPDALAGSDDDIHGSDANLDANTAAEYLDNTLSPDAVAEFERSCLEAGPNADMLLAEAASCHHVLTMVLGEPAEVDADLRQRMYALAQSPAAAPQLKSEPAPANQPAAAATMAAVPTAAPVSRRSQIDADEASVPDFMLAAAREQRRRTRRMALAFVGAMALGGLAVFLLWPQGPVEVPPEVAQMGGADQISQGVVIGDSKESGKGADEEAKGATSTAETEAPPFDANAAKATPATPAATTAAAGAKEIDVAKASPPPAPPQPTAGQDKPTPPPAVMDQAMAAATATSEATPQAPATAAATPPTNTPPVEGPEMQVPAAAQTQGTAAANVPPPATPTPIATSGDAGPPAGQSTPSPVVPAPPTGPPAGPTTSIAEAGAATPTAATPNAKPTPVGSYIGIGDLLLGFDPGAKSWLRVPQHTQLLGGEQLLALPTFRTHVGLGNANIMLNDGASIEVIPAAKVTGQPRAEFGLRVPYGQLIINSGLNGNRFELSLVDQDRVVQLDPSSSLALDVRRMFEPGQTAKREPAPAVVTWYLTSGRAAWGDGKRAEAPATWTTAHGEDSTPAAVEKLPDWVQRETVTEIERRARERLAEAIVPGQPADKALLEISDPNSRRRTEDRTLAAYCGAYVGQYDALVRLLADVNQRAFWQAEIEALRAAIARDPSAAEGIHKAFALERGEQAANDLMEMLLGFDRVAIGTTKDEVKNGAMVRLLRWMEDDDLTTRVLATYNINEITGTKQLGNYRPEHPADKRKIEMKHYWTRLENGELIPKGATP